MKVVLIGGTGLIGRALVQELIAHRHEVVLVTRSVRHATAQPNVHVVQWHASLAGAWTQHLDRADAVVNLAGESIGSRRWTKSQKQRILSSRIDTTSAIALAIAQSSPPPRLLVNASAVGYYGNVPDGDVTEATPKGIGFLADVCERWEREALQALRAAPNIRVLLLRTGIVLHPSAGALQKLLLPFQLFAGGPLGSGRQWFPWIHLADEVAAIRFLLEHPTASGPFNLSAPNPVTMKQFCQALGRAMRRPSWVSVPGFALKGMLGEMAGPLVLEGQRMIPAKLQELGYGFQYPKLQEALDDLLRKREN